MFFPKVVCKILACVCRWKERSNMMKCGFIPCCIFQNMFQHKEHFKLRSRLLTLVFKVTPPSGLPTLPLLSPVLLTSPLFQSTQAAHCAYNILIQQSSNKHLFKVHHTLGILLKAIEERSRSHCFCPYIVGNLVGKTSKYMNKSNMKWN